MSVRRGLGREVRGEAVDHFDDADAEFLKGIAPYSTLAERYLDGCDALHVHLGFQTLGVLGDDSIAVHVCAVVQHAPSPADLDLDLGGSRLDSDLRLLSPDAPSQDWVKEAVLVDVREVDKDGERSADLDLRTVVRLQLLDDCSMVATHASEHRVEAARRRSFRVDRELVALPGLATIQQDELPDEIVEGRAQVVDELADEHRPNKIGLLQNPEAGDLPFALRLKLAGDQIRTALEVGPELLLESVHVRVSPGEPCTAPV